MFFSSVVGVGLTLTASGVVQSQLAKRGKQELADTLDSMTTGSVLLYSVYFIWKLLSFSATTFL